MREVEATGREGPSFPSEERGEHSKSIAGHQELDVVPAE
jgi:hypothetical protein